ncbi:MAG TPA: sugar phosphate isomerase/epimerase family protein [Solirubrobacteraceae bacterium]|jgi:sugar phosphate isomerase/epimerase
MSVPAAEPALTLWCGCVISHDLYARAEAVTAGGYTAMSALCGDFAALERSGSTLAQIAAELRAREARVSVIDPFLAWYPSFNVGDDAGPHADSLNTTEENMLRYADAVGAESMTLLTPFSGDPAPRDQVVQALGALADRVAEHGLRVHLEVVPTSQVPDLETGWGIIREVDRPNAGLVLDTFHLGRSGADPAMLDEIPLEKVFHLQLCDASREPVVADYFEEAVTYRDFPGEGELGVADYVRHLYRDGRLPTCGPEVFSPELTTLSAADAGRLCAERARSFLRECALGE